jgi:hypothetical protein
MKYKFIARYREYELVAFNGSLYTSYPVFKHGKRVGFVDGDTIRERIRNFKRYVRWFES